MYRLASFYVLGVSGLAFATRIQTRFALKFSGHLVEDLSPFYNKFNKMNVNLLKKLLPGEVDEFMVRNKVRQDGRELRSHRAFQISRSVLGQTGTENDQLQLKASCAVRLG